MQVRLDKKNAAAVRASAKEMRRSNSEQVNWVVAYFYGPMTEQGKQAADMQRNFKPMPEFTNQP
jgi:hypothetical protein